MTHSYVCHNTGSKRWTASNGGCNTAAFYIWLIHMCDMTQGASAGQPISIISNTATSWTSHTTHSYVLHDSFIRVAWLIHTCIMTSSYMSHDSSIHVTWLIHTCHMTQSFMSCVVFTCQFFFFLILSYRVVPQRIVHLYVSHDSFIRVPWLVYTCYMTHSFVSHDSSTCVTWLIHSCPMTLLYVLHDSFIRVPWLFYTCYMTHSFMSHDSSIRVAYYAFISVTYDALIRVTNYTFISVTWLTYTCHMTHLYAWHIMHL